MWRETGLVCLTTEVHSCMPNNSPTHMVQISNSSGKQELYMSSDDCVSDVIQKVSWLKPINNCVWKFQHLRHSDIEQSWLQLSHNKKIK
jgi:hypothetical protein